MNVGEARALGVSLADNLNAGRATVALALVEPLLASRTPFRLLDVLGSEIGGGEHQSVNDFLDDICRSQAEGGWAIIGSALRARLALDLPGAIDSCRRYAIAGDVWCAADILAERVPGPALVDQFDRALTQLATWRTDPNRWVRKMVGVATHFWAKRSRGSPDQLAHGAALLSFLEPMFEERNLDAAKGIGWGLKTMGRHYPAPVADWLIRQQGRPHRAVVWRKALTYLPPEQRRRVAGD